MALGIFWATVSLVFFMGFTLLDMAGIFSRKNHFNVDGRTVVITGGSQGMGRALGKLLAQKGANIVIVARNQQKLDDALKYISSAAKNTGKQRFHAISADVTKAEENTRLISEVTEWNNGRAPDVVWANAGGAHPSLFIETPIETLRSQMDLNFWAATYLAHTTLRSWLKPSSTKLDPESAAAIPQRHFIITSSTVAFVGLAGYSPYATAKTALRSLADSLRNEIRLYNGYRSENPAKGPYADVEIHLVTPGTIFSPGFEEENKTKPAVTTILEESDPRQTEDEVAKAAVKGLEKGHYLITTQWLGHAMKASMLGGSPRNSLFIDTIMSWFATFLWIFVQPDLEKKVTRWGMNNKVKLPQ